MSHQTSEKEQLLIAGCKHSEMWARKKLYERYAPAMMGVCIRYTGDREAARDVLQEGFIKVFIKIDTYSEIGSFEGWMRRIFVTTALEYLRKDLSNRFFDEYDEKVKDSGTSALEKLSADELLACIAELPNGFRTIFNMYAIEGYSHSEIAKILKIKESTSRSQFARARQLLQKNIQSIRMYDTRKNK